MGKVLVVAEKPSVGRDIAKVLKCTKKGDGYLFSDAHIVSWAIGHLVTLFEPDDYDEGLKRWKMETLPIIPEEIKLKGIANTKSQLKILKGLMNNKEVDSIICATDSGREGELIFRYIYDITKCKKPFDRLWISSMTDAAINDGFKKLKPGAEYDNLYASAKCRSEADWLVGINASRAFTIKYNALLSIGRVQTPTLAIIVEKQKDINVFVPADYWEVTAFFDSLSSDRYKGKWFNKEDNETKISDKEKAETIVEKTKGQKGIVTSIENEEKKQANPLLYDLTELQRDCNRKFGFPAAKTLTVAQDLYEKRKMVTYPRTDSRYLSQDMIPKIGHVLQKLSAVEAYRPFTGYVHALAKLPITKRIVDDTKITDHHAIIPTEANINLHSLSGDEFKVYDLIARRFLSVFYPYYIYNVTKIITEVCGESFLTKGSTVVQYGWMELYKNEKLEEKKKNEDEEEAILPALTVNDEVSAGEVISELKKTQPPKPYTEASLLSAMENAGRFIEDDDLKEQLKDSGLGTPATRAAIIERLLHVGYITRKGKTLIPTDKGMKLIDIVPNELKSPETTGKWEKGLTSISKGKMDSNKFMGSINRYVYYIVDQAKRSDSRIVFPEERKPQSNKPKQKSLGKCPLCKTGEMYENTKAFYCNRWKENCKFTIWKEATARYGYTMTPQDISKLLAGEKIKVNITLPQTHEKAEAELVLKPDSEAKVEFINLNRTTANGELMKE